MSISVASMTGAIAAIAEPPQIPVPALMRLLVFQFSPIAFPISAPRPKHVARVNTITVRENLPTVSTVRIFRLAPSRIIANFRIFFDVNLIPGRCHAVRLVKGIHNHTDKHGDDRRPDKVQSGALLQAFQEFRRSGNYQCNQPLRESFFLRFSQYVSSSFLFPFSLFARLF